MKYRVGVIGATGMVGQRLLTLLSDHPIFDVKILAASYRNKNKIYENVMTDRWAIEKSIPEKFKKMVIFDANDVEIISKKVDIVFCAIDLDKEETLKLEENYARHEVVVVSNNSANRNTSDVPMIIPEINSEHLKIIDVQRKRLNTKKGFICVKSNCSLQSFVPPLTPLLKLGATDVCVATYQAISGAGKNFYNWPNMEGNLIPYIEGEEEKTENEPHKIWGKIENDQIKNISLPRICSQCYRVPILNGHTAAVFVKFSNKPERESIVNAWEDFNKLCELSLHSSPKKFLSYVESPDRPEIRKDLNTGHGMTITIGGLRECFNQYDYKFNCLSHNVIRGAAGGAILMAELIEKMGYLN